MSSTIVNTGKMPSALAGSARYAAQLVSLLVLLSGAAAPALAAALTFEGSMMQGGLLQGRTEPGTSVTVDGQAVRVSDEGIFLIGFGRDAGAEAEVVAVFADGTRERRSLNVRQREYEIQRIDGLPTRKVTPTKEDLKRIREEAAQVKRARQRDDPRLDFLDGFAWPVVGQISGVYGSQRILNGQPRRPHYGIDIAAPAGTAVLAPAAGVVTFVHRDMFFSGGTLIVDHGHGLSSSFLHLSRILVAEGQRVKQGQAIAEVGATGRATGAHLDWRMNLFQRRLDPALLLGPMPED